MAAPTDHHSVSCRFITFVNDKIFSVDEEVLERVRDKDKFDGNMASIQIVLKAIVARDPLLRKELKTIQENLTTYFPNAHVDNNARTEGDAPPVFFGAMGSILKGCQDMTLKGNALRHFNPAERAEHDMAAISAIIDYHDKFTKFMKTAPAYEVIKLWRYFFYFTELLKVSFD